jgi:predicted  nucleic acid-binding Zn-ribbon protein
MSQRQENLNARLELEKEIKRLQEEVVRLSAENQQLRRDKEDVEQQFIDFKIKNDETVTKLRGN